MLGMDAGESINCGPDFSACRLAPLGGTAGGAVATRFLLLLHRVIDQNFAALLHCDYLVDGGVAAGGHVDYIVAGIKHHVDGNALVEHVLVDCDLSSLGLSMNADRALVGLSFLAE